MQDEYVTAFYNIVSEVKLKVGFALPTHLEVYVVMLLADHVDKSNFLPKKTFAESYLSLNNINKSQAKKLGDTCLFVTGVFPEYNNNRGFSIDYYSAIGKSSYHLALSVSRMNIFESLTQHFDAVRDYISYIMNKKKLPSLF